MKHIFNDISKEEKQKILEQHSGGMVIDNKKFLRLLESSLGNVKPILNEEGDVATNAKNCGWGSDVASYKASGFMCPKKVPTDWTNFPCVPSHPSAVWTKNSDGTFLMSIGSTIYYNNGRKTLNDKMVEFTCQDPEFKSVKRLSSSKLAKATDAPKNVKAFQTWVLNTKKDARVLGSYSADGVWGPRTQTAWSLYKTEYQKSNPGQ